VSEREAPATGRPSPFALVREAFSLCASAAVTRGELAAVELAEARQRAMRWLALALTAAVLLLAALTAASLLVLAVFWDSYRWQAIALLFGLYGLAGAAAAAWCVAEARAAPRLFDATLEALKRDCDALRSTGAP
jgi:uncharacterized membrane protein YqjE